MKTETKKRLNKLAQIIYDKKGFNIFVLDVNGISTITDYLIIAEGNIDRHIQAIAQEILEEMKEEKEIPLHVEGMQDGDWVVIDYLDVIIHLFIPQLREKYQLEKLWNDGKIVNVQINTK